MGTVQADGPTKVAVAHSAPSSRPEGYLPPFRLWQVQEEQRNLRGFRGETSFAVTDRAREIRRRSLSSIRLGHAYGRGVSVSSAATMLRQEPKCSAKASTRGRTVDQRFRRSCQASIGLHVAAVAVKSPLICLSSASTWMKYQALNSKGSTSQQACCCQRVPATENFSVRLLPKEKEKDCTHGPGALWNGRVSSPYHFAELRSGPLLGLARTPPRNSCLDPPVETSRTVACTSSLDSKTLTKLDHLTKDM